MKKTYQDVKYGESTVREGLSEMMTFKLRSKV